MLPWSAMRADGHCSPTIHRIADPHRAATGNLTSAPLMSAIETGGKRKLGPISKQGDRYLRRILVVGAHSVLRRAKQSPQNYPWLTQLLARRPFKVVAVALANKMARIAWALLAKGETYRAPVIATGSPVTALPAMAR